MSSRGVTAPLNIDIQAQNQQVLELIERGLKELQTTAEKFKREPIFSAAEQDAAALEQRIESVQREIQETIRRSDQLARNAGSNLDNRFGGTTQVADAAGDLDSRFVALAGSMDAVAGENEALNTAFVATAGVMEGTEAALLLLRDGANASVFALGAAALAIGAISFAASEGFKDAREENEKFIDELDALTDARRLEVQVIGETTEAIQDRIESQQQELVILEAQRQELQRQLQQAREQRFLGLFGDTGVDQLEDSLADVNREIGRVEATVGALTSASVTNSAVAADFLRDLEDEANQRREVASVIRDVTAAEVERQKVLLEGEARIFEDNAEKIREQISDIENANQEALASAIQNLGTVTADQFNEAAIQIAGSGREAFRLAEEGVFDQLSEDLEALAEPAVAAMLAGAKDIEDLQRRLQDLFAGRGTDEALLTAQRLTQIISSLPQFADGLQVLQDNSGALSTYTDALDENQQAIDDIRSRQEIWTTVIADAAAQNDAATEAIERMTARTQALTDAMTELETVNEQIADLESDIAAERAEQAREAERNAQRAVLDDSIAEAEAVVAAEKVARAFIDIENDRLAAAEAASQQYADAQAALAEQIVNDVANAGRDLFRDLTDLDTELERAKEDIRRTFTDAITGAARNNDTRAAVEAAFNASNQLRDAGITNDRAREDRLLQFDREIDDLEQHHLDRERELQENYRDELAAIDEQADKKRRLQQQANNRELSAAEQHLQDLHNQEQALNARFAAERRELQIVEQAATQQALLNSYISYRNQLAGVLDQTPASAPPGYTPPTGLNIPAALNPSRSAPTLTPRNLNPRSGAGVGATIDASATVIVQGNADQNAIDDIARTLNNYANALDTVVRNIGVA